MHRRDFSRTLLGASALGLLTPAHAFAAPPGLAEGSDYRRLSSPAPVDAPAGQIEVLEFFSYTCSHCFNFEPLLKDWLKQKPAYVSFRQVPVFSEPFQRVYYALETMGQLEAAHSKLFELFHVAKIRPANTKPESLTEWVTRAGVDGPRFAAALNSFSVAGKVRKATALQDAYQVEGTPAMGVAGRFLVPGQGPRTLTIANALIADLRKG